MLRFNHFARVSRQTRFYAILFIIIVFLFIFYLFVLDQNYSLGDAYWYSHVAEQRYNRALNNDTGSFWSLQNGIIIVHLSLLKLGITVPMNRILIIEVLNLVSYCASLVILGKVLKKVGIEQNLQWLILSLMVVSVHLFWSFLNPVNDGLSYLLAFICLFLFYYRGKNPHFIYLLVFALSVLGVTFRFLNILVILSMSLASLIEKKYRKFVIYLCITVCSLLFLRLINHLLFPSESQLGATADLVRENFSFRMIWSSVKRLFQYALPGLFFGSSVYLSALYVFFVPLMGFIVVQGIFHLANKRSSLLFLSIYIVLMCLVSALFIVIEPRYLLTIYPFIIVLVIYSIRKQKWCHFALIIFLVINCATSVFRLSIYNFDFTINKTNSENIGDMLDRYQVDDYYVDTHMEEAASVLLNFSPREMLISKEGADAIIILGLRSFVDEKIHVVESHNYRVVLRREGWLLLKDYSTGKKERLLYKLYQRFPGLYRRIFEERPIVSEYRDVSSVVLVKM